MAGDPTFIPGLELSARFYREAVAPILSARFPGLRHAAARLDSGSDVIGFDTPQSRDHGWGPRLQIFLDEDDAPRYAEALDRALADELPLTFAGYPTSFASKDISSSWMAPAESHPITHGVSVTTVRRFCRAYLAITPDEPLDPPAWLGIPEHRLLTLRAGQVFHDGLGELGPLRERLRYYPHDLWLHLLAAQWWRIGQEEPFMARCGDVGDDLGSRLLAARMARDVMRLAFLMEQQYAPYSKWYGSAFARLTAAPRLAPHLEAALRAETWRERESHLSRAYVAAAELHNGLGITPPLAPAVAPFYDRPYQVIGGGRFFEAIRARITDAAVLRLPPTLGAIAQLADSTDILEYPEHAGKLRALYG